MLFLFSTCLLAQNSEIFPCPQWFGPSWGNLITRSICTGIGEDQLQLSSCSPNCCITFKYYTRWLTIGHRLPTPMPGEWEVSITNIYRSSETECNGCSDQELIEAFYKQLWKENLQINLFKERIGVTASNNVIYNQHLYTPTKCMQENLIDVCDTNSRCCQNVYNINTYPTDNTLNSENGIVGTDNANTPEMEDVFGNFSSIYSGCSPSILTCPPHPRCFELKSETYNDMICSFPACNSSDVWITQPAEILTVYPDGCTQSYVGCQLEINYMKKINNCTQPPIIELKITSIDLVNCVSAPTFSFDDHGIANPIGIIPITVIDYGGNPCTWDFASQDIYKIAERWILEKAALIDVDLGTCTDQYRVSRVSCWWFFDGSENFPLHWEPCSDGSCCWAQYHICHNVPEGVNSITLLQKSSYDNTCITLSCQDNFYICDVDASLPYFFPKISIDEQNFHGIIDNKSSSFCVPNPADNKFDIHFISQYHGLVGLKILDILGNIIFSSEYNKKDVEIVISITNQNLSNGQYFYQLSMNNSLENTGKILILR